MAVRLRVADVCAAAVSSSFVAAPGPICQVLRRETWLRGMTPSIGLASQY